MKTSRLVLLFALILLVLNGTGDAAATPPDGPEKTYLPLVLNGWVPNITAYTRFDNESENLLLSLKIDGNEQVEVPLAPGESITVALPAGTYRYTVQLGRTESGNTFPLYEWPGTFVQAAGTLGVVTIHHPALADVLSGFGNEMYWTDRLNIKDAPDGLCFYPDGSYQIYPTTACFERGTLQETDAVNDTRTFNLLDEFEVVRYTGTYYLSKVPCFDLAELEGGADPWLTDYERKPGVPCPAMPECDLNTRASSSVRR